MKPDEITCKGCGKVYVAYMPEFAVCPVCGEPATADDKDTNQAGSEEERE